MFAVTPAQMMRLSLTTATMLAEAQMVIAMRLWGMAGLWHVHPAENGRMVSEKVAAGMAGANAAGRAMMAGRDAVAIADAAMAPMARKTHANARRLARRGPKTGL